MEKKDLKHYIKSYTFEIAASIVFLALIIFFLADDNFSKDLVTNFEFFRPEYSFTFFIVFVAIFMVLALLFAIQARKRKLKSTKKKSAFAKTIECSHKVREMSQTQTVITSSSSITGKKNAMPKDVDGADSSVIEFYFDYEEKLNI